MVRANRGAARVGLMWTVMMAVITIAGLAFGFFAYDERSKALEEAAEARAAADRAQELQVEADQKVSQLSTALGFYERDSTVKIADPNLAADVIARMRDAFPDIPSNVQDFEEAIPYTIATVQALRQEIDTKQSRIDSLQSELETARTSRDRDIRAKDETIARLEDELANERANAADREQNLNDRIADSESENDQLDRQLREARADHEDQVRGLNVEIADLQQRLGAALTKLDVRIQRARTQEPDGSILTVSSTLPLAWIDRGTNDRLAPGMGFIIRAERTSGAVDKARAIVRRVERNRAEIEILDLADEYDPVVKGDLIYSPIYDREGERTAVLAGRFSGTWDEQRLTMILEDMGIRVQENLSGTTDMLITGGEIYYDELGEPLEDPLDPSQLPIYTEAANAGITIVPLSTLRDFLPAMP